MAAWQVDKKRSDELPKGARKISFFMFHPIPLCLGFSINPAESTVQSWLFCREVLSFDFLLFLIWRSISVRVPIPLTSPDPTSTLTPTLTRDQSDDDTGCAALVNAFVVRRVETQAFSAACAALTTKRT